MRNTFKISVTLKPRDPGRRNQDNITVDFTVTECDDMDWEGVNFVKPSGKYMYQLS
jgi:hypothetical protein